MSVIISDVVYEMSQTKRYIIGVHEAIGVQDEWPTFKTNKTWVFGSTALSNIDIL